MGALNGLGEVELEKGQEEGQGQGERKGSTRLGEEGRSSDICRAKSVK